MNPNDAQRMAEPLREEIVIRSSEPVLAGEVEGDAGYGRHQGHPEAVKKRGGKAGGGA